MPVALLFQSYLYRIEASKANDKAKPLPLGKRLTYTSTSFAQDSVVTLLGLDGIRTFSQSIDGRLMNLLPLVE
jgi:hypothetical protein